MAAGATGNQGGRHCASAFSSNCHNQGIELSHRLPILSRVLITLPHQEKDMKLKRLCAAITVAAAGMAAGTSFADVDASLATYERVGGVSGSLSSVGSDSLANMMTLWAEEFKRHYPNVNVQIQAAGSSTAPPALTEGTSSLAPMSRKMKDSELQAFEEKYGYKPVEIPVAIDAQAVFADKDNPIEGLTMAQLDDDFSSTVLCGNDSDITTWGQAGLDGQWENRDIQLYGRNSVSGTYGYFKEQALCKGDFKSGVNEQPGSASVVQSISQSLNAIGYSGIGYR